MVQGVEPLLTGWNIILALKAGVGLSTVLFVGSFVPLARGNSRLHGRINLAFFILTLGALLGLELLARIWDPHLFDYFDSETRRRLFVHLCFSVPAAMLMPVMLYTGLTHRRRLHVALGVLFGVLWAGTFVTGMFFLPHRPPGPIGELAP